MNWQGIQIHAVTQAMILAVKGLIMKLFVIVHWIVKIMMIAVLMPV